MTEMPDCYPETLGVRKGCGCTEKVVTGETQYVEYVQDKGEYFELNLENPEESRGDVKVHLVHPFARFHYVGNGLQVHDALRFYYTCLNCGTKMRHIKNIEGPKAFIHDDGRWDVKEERTSDSS